MFGKRSAQKTEDTEYEDSNHDNHEEAEFEEPIKQNGASVGETDSKKPEEHQNNFEEENKKLKETLMRTLAELDNTRKRSIEENDKIAKYAISKFAEDLIPVMEDFYLAFESVKDADLCDEKTAKSFFDGIRLTQNELKKAFDRNGLTRLFPLNEDFNPDLHNAIAQVESDVDEGKVVQVMQAGYKIKDRLLRPALVCVSKPKA